MSTPSPPPVSLLSSSHHPSLLLLPASPLWTTFSPRNSDLSGKSESRPVCLCSPTVRAHTHTHVPCNRASTPCQMHTVLRLRLFIAFFHGNTPPIRYTLSKTFSKICQKKGALDGTVSPASEEKGSEEHSSSSSPSLPVGFCFFFFLMFRSGLDAEVNQMYWNP